jgi:hypothetical protein
VALGIASRLVDTADGAPPWIGLVLSPWLAGPWLAGAWVARHEDSLGWGAVAGLALLSCTVLAYLALAGADAAALLPGLPLLAVAAGLGFGAAGAQLHRGKRGRLIAAVALGAIFAIEGVLLQQLAAESILARALLMLEAIAGVVLAAWLAGRAAGMLVLVAGALVLGMELALQATIGPALA